jgi:hypothetical protein
MSRPSKIYPNWGFWFEKIPSGNPGHDKKRKPEASQITEAFDLACHRLFQQKINFAQVANNGRKNKKEKRPPIK